MNKKFTYVVWMLFCCFTLKAQPADTLRWREVFTNPQLVQLIDTALVHNTNLRVASLHVEQADAQLRMTRLSLLPTVSVGGDGNFSREKSSAATSKYSLPVRLQWEVSLSGRFFAEKRPRSIFFGVQKRRNAPCGYRWSLPLPASITPC